VAMPVRTWSDTFAPVATTWLTPDQSEFLDEVRSPFGNSLRVRLERALFRIRWLEMDIHAPKFTRMPGLNSSRD